MRLLSGPATCRARAAHRRPARRRRCGPRRAGPAAPGRGRRRRRRSRSRRAPGSPSRPARGAAGRARPPSWSGPQRRRVSACQVGQPGVADGVRRHQQPGEHVVAAAASGPARARPGRPADGREQPHPGGSPAARRRGQPARPGRLPPPADPPRRGRTDERAVPRPQPAAGSTGVTTDAEQPDRLGRAPQSTRHCAARARLVVHADPGAGHLDQSAPVRRAAAPAVQDAAAGTTRDSRSDPTCRA